jgi:thioredoxin-related protein
MKQIVVVALVLFHLSTQAQTAVKGIKFERNLTWKQVMEMAHRDGKYIFVDLYATWCIPCKKMDKEVYVDDSVGIVMNHKFVSIKVQMDTTESDPGIIKNWYQTAADFNKKFNIEAYPTFLFFDPTGNLIYRDFGYKTKQQLIELSGRALKSHQNSYGNKLAEYKAGKTQQDGLMDLAIYANALGEYAVAKQIAGDYISFTSRQDLLTRQSILFVSDIAMNAELADSLSREYKASYLDKLSESEICTKEVLDFIIKFYKVVNSSDKFFKLSYHEPWKVDSIVGEGRAKFIVDRTVTTEEIDNIVPKDPAPKIKERIWKDCELRISKKYDSVDEQLLVLNYQIRLYKALKDWKQWSLCQDKKIKVYPPKHTALDVFIQINQPAWTAFLFSNDRDVLKKALRWSNLSIKLQKTEPNPEYFDTRANILYKLGKVKEAIEQQEIAVKATKDIGTSEKFQRVLEKMRAGKPTYIEEGAIWKSKN